MYNLDTISLTIIIIVSLVILTPLALSIHLVLDTGKTFLTKKKLNCFDYMDVVVHGMLMWICVYFTYEFFQVVIQML